MPIAIIAISGEKHEKHEREGLRTESVIKVIYAVWKLTIGHKTMYVGTTKDL